MRTLRLKKNEDRRLISGHLWIYSNEIDNTLTPLNNFQAGDEVIIINAKNMPIAKGYVNPHSLIAVRIMTRQPEENIDKVFFVQKILQAVSIRQRLFKKPFYRLIYGESDGLPGLIADRYHETLVLQINTAGLDVKTPMIIEAFRQALPEIEHILLRNDSPARLQEGLNCFVDIGFGHPPQQVQLEENHTLFKAPIWEGQKTGWFFDHRFNRLRLKDYVAQQSVLDVFSYLGAWGIQAGTFGATAVTFIDASPMTKQFIEENILLNKLQMDTKIIIDDAFKALKNLIHTKAKFNVIIVDPPAFVKKNKDLKEGLLAYQRIYEAALKLLDTNGILIACSCSMHVSYDALIESLRRASFNSHAAIQILERGHQAADHPVHLSIPETDYLKMVIVRKSDN